MINTRFRKSYLFLLTVILVLGGMLFAGSTLATDETAIKKVLPGVDMQVYDKATGAYTSLVQKSAFSEDLLWCPGATHIAYIQVVNGVDVDVEFSLVLDVDVTMAGFGDYLTYAVLPLTAPGDMTFTNWRDFRTAAQKTGTLIDNTTPFWETLTGPHENVLVPRTELAAGKTTLYAIAIHMDEHTPNKYQEASMTFKFILGAEQDISSAGVPNPESTRTPVPGASN